jgi:HK97 family phage prohead protease
MERKAFATEFKVDTAKRIIEGYASVFGNRDQADDVVVPGAYKKTLEGRVERIKVMRDHKILIGRALHAEEDSTGLYTRSQVSKTRDGDEALELVADGALNSMSIQYDTIKADYAAHTDGAKARFLKELKLYEFGPVTWPCNEAAVITGVKQIEDLDRAFHEFKAGRLPVADLVALVSKAAVTETAPLAAPPAHAEMHQPDTSESAALLAEIKAMLGDYRSQFRRAA